MVLTDTYKADNFSREPSGRPKPLMFILRLWLVALACFWLSGTSEAQAMFYVTDQVSVMCQSCPIGSAEEDGALREANGEIGEEGVNGVLENLRQAVKAKMP